MVGDIREHVETCPTCQLEKTDHTLKKGSLQSLAIPEAKWQEVSVDFITDLPTTVGGEDSIMIVVDHATKMNALDTLSEDHDSREKLQDCTGSTWSNCTESPRRSIPIGVHSL